MSRPNRHLFRYCPHCRTELASRREGGVERPVCPSCGFVQYLNPAPGAGVIVLRGDRVCLVKRKFEPRQGMWCLPTGFMEWDEDVRLTARREALEETGLEVRLTELFAVESGVLPPDIPVLVVFYRAEETGGTLQAGDDASEAAFFPLDDLPARVAFAAHRAVLRRLHDLWLEGDPKGGRHG